MSWVSPNMAAASSKLRSSSSSPSSSSVSDSNEQSTPVLKLGSEYLETPLTPPNVKDFRPSICLALSDFKDLMRQYRSLDDGITTRLNRTFARYRDLGLASSPTLLSSSTSSTSTATDLGTSTYSVAPQQACAQFWKELVTLWIGREQVIDYCRKVTHSSLLQQPTSSSPLSEDDKLNADLLPPKPTPSTLPWGRGEDSQQFLHRQLENELVVETIIRKRSLDAFKSRCKFFQPSPPSGPQGDRERALWEGKSSTNAFTSY